MTQTTNYQLPQWEANDPVRREDFNQAFAALDGAYGPEQKPYVSGTFSVTCPSTSGTVVHTFDFEPEHILVSVADVVIIRQGDSGKVYATVGGTSYIMLRLSGNQVLYSSSASVSGIFTVTCVAYR